MISLVVRRTAFGEDRTECACSDCKLACHEMPGYLLPGDLYRLSGCDDLDSIVAWAEDHLLASPGAIVASRGMLLRIRTLVPQRVGVRSGPCHWMSEDGSCKVHADSPFGCAFFSRHVDGEALSTKGLRLLIEEWMHRTLCTRVWHALNRKGLVSDGPKVG